MRKLSRDSLKKSQSAMKDPTSFIEGAETKATQKKIDRRKPVSVSLNDKDFKELHSLIKRFNKLSYEQDDDGYEAEINRSLLIVAMKDHFLSMDDKDFYKAINRTLFPES